MKKYIYPQNLKAEATLWLWSLRDFAITGVATLISVVALAQTGFMAPLALCLAYGFLSIRAGPGGETTILSFVRFATRYFLLSQQYYVWRNAYD